MKDWPLIMLDEPSAHRDPASERHILAPMSMLAHEAEIGSREELE